MQGAGQKRPEAYAGAGHPEPAGARHESGRNHVRGPVFLPGHICSWL